MRFTIEARAITTEHRRGPASDVHPHPVTVEAGNPGDALIEYVRACEGELVSVSSPSRGGESIATVKQEDTVFLVRVYGA